MTSENGQAQAGQADGVAGIVDLADINQERRELGILRRAAHEDWAVPSSDRPAIVKRMVGIVKRTSVTVATMTGPVEDESTADVHAIAAARVLVSMVAHDQADLHHVEGGDKPAVRVNVNNFTLVVPPPKVIGANPHP